MRVVIFGAGIAGLTAAHELVELGHNVTILESSNSIGGEAKSGRDSKGCATEHSWRGWAPFYWNCFEMMKRIPLIENSGKSVYDNLEIDLKFSTPVDDGRKHIGTGPYDLSLLDKISFGFHYYNNLMSSRKRLESLDNIHFSETYSSLSKDGNRIIIKAIGPFPGQDYNKVSELTMQKFYELHHKLNNPSVNTGWLYPNAPTSESWFNHWEAKLNKLGVQIVKNTKVTSIKFDKGGNVVGLLTSDDDHHADVYISAVPINELYRIGIKDFQELARKSYDIMEGLQIYFDKSIFFGPGREYCVILPDSLWNLTIAPQDIIWPARDKVPVCTKIPAKGIWTITPCMSDVPGISGKTWEESTPNEILDECWRQIMKCNGFLKIIRDENGFDLSEATIIHSNVGIHVTPKFGNNVGVLKLRPEIDALQDKHPNLLICGSWTYTDINLWSMEGAVESGKRAAKKIDDGVIVLRDNAIRPLSLVLSPFRSIDNLTYSLYLPPPLTLIIVTFVILIFYLIYRKL